MRHWLLLLWFAPSVVYGQQKDSLISSYLEEVTVYGMPVSKYAAGTKVENISLNNTSFLQQDLSTTPSIYFKNYGNDQLSTIAFRGTSASHTAVLWNGMNISSPTLGQTDFALLPSFLLEDVAVQFGTASSQYGSDALGGTVLLNQSKPTFKRGLLLHAQQQAGSFGRYFSGLKMQLSNDRWEFRTKVMDRRLENNFSYNSPGVGYRKKQNNAAVKTYGFDQQLHYKLANDKWLSFEAFYTFNHRDIQPNVTNDNSKETLQDKNTRLNLSYRGNHSIGLLYASAGYILNDELYNRNQDTRTRQFTGIINIDRPLGSRSTLRYGGNASFFNAQSDGYAGIKRESRYDFFISLNHQLLPRWNISTNVRQSFYAGHYAPFSPSIGSQLDLIKNNSHTLSFLSQASRGYRVPTLNDRYWSPGGNPAIKPEDAYHVEGGLSWKEFKTNHVFNSNITVYKTLVDRWILWQPDTNGLWSPMNLQKVNAYGAETSVSYKLITNRSTWETGINYSYTRSKIIRDQSDQTNVGKQLSYVPYHQSNFYGKFTNRKWQANAYLNYTGYRYTNLSNDAYHFLKSYYLINLSAVRKAEIKNLSLALQLQVNNILNIYYETYENHAMPGRNFNLNLIINFKIN